MAVSLSLREDYLTCPICSQIYKEPRTLHCFHTFCKYCLGQYIEMGGGVFESTGILCPVCRQLTPVPDPQKPVEEWIGQLKHNFYIAGLIEELHPKESVCCICGDEDRKISIWCLHCDNPFCEKCAEFHQKMPASQAHEVLETASLSWESIQSKRLRLCVEHKHTISLFCEDCDVLACQICISVKHRKCVKVITVSDAAKIRRALLDKYLDCLLSNVEMIQTRLTKRKEKRKDFIEQKQAAEKTIKERIENVTEVLKDTEGSLLQEVETTCRDALEYADECIQRDEKIEKVSLQNLELVNQLKTSGSDLDVIEQKIYMSDCSFVAKEIHNQKHITAFHFQSDKAVFLDQVRSLSLGKLNVSYDEDNTTTEVEIPQKPATPKTSFSVMFKEDKMSPWTLDVLAVENNFDTIVVTDYGNNCVKMFYTIKKQSIKDRLSLCSSPWSITKTADSEVAVSLPKVHKICIISVLPNLKIQSQFQTRKEYYGIAMIGDNTLAVSTPRGRGHLPSVDLIEFGGKFLKSFTEDPAGYIPFSRPSFLRFTANKDIIVSDWGEKAVVGLTKSGAVRFKWEPGKTVLKYPFGITYDAASNILVVDSELNKVIKLTEGGHFVQDELTSNEVDKPLGVYIDSNNNLYVTEASGDIKIFSLNEA